MEKTKTTAKAIKESNIYGLSLPIKRNKAHPVRSSGKIRQVRKKDY